MTYGGERGHRRLTNSAFAVAPDLSIVSQYDKHHLVPFGEYVPLEKALHIHVIQAVVPDIGFFDPGETLEVFTLHAKVSPPGGGPATEAREVRYAPEICYDAIFPEMWRRLRPPGSGLPREPHQRRLVRLLVGLLPVPLDGDDARHRRRQGDGARRPTPASRPSSIRPVGILSRTGIGLIDTESDTASANSAVPPVLLEGEVPLLREHTPYVVIGDAFAYLCAVFAALACGWPPRRRAHAGR